MAAGGTLRVVVLALLANLGIALAKLVAALFTHSGSMLAEAIHSFADSGNQVLLLLGHTRSRRAPDGRHPLGYGREAYFWALIVAALLFVLGGVFSLYEGLHKAMHPRPLDHVGWALGVLAVSILLEGISLRAAWRESRAARGSTPLLRWARRTGDVNLVVVVCEDLAALAGLLVALVAVLLAALTGESLFDAVGSCVIGVLLLLVASFVGGLVRRLIIGLSASGDVRQHIEALWSEHGFDLLNLFAIWDGPGRILVACKVRPRDAHAEVATVMEQINQVERRVREAHPEVELQFIEPDTTL